MQNRLERVRWAILKILAQQTEPCGASRLRPILRGMGIDLEARTIRFHLHALDGLGLTRCPARRRGREITAAGREEVRHAPVFEKVGFFRNRLDTLACQMQWDGERGRGWVGANAAELDYRDLSRAVFIMEPVFQRQLAYGDRARVEGSPGRSGWTGHRVRIHVVDSSVIVGLCLQRGIPLIPRYGALAEIRDRVPHRLLEMIDYQGCSMDPVELFIRARMTTVQACVEKGRGVVGVAFYEYPSVRDEAIRGLVRQMERKGLGGVVWVGSPSEPVLGVPVGEGRTGMLVLSGLNALAILVEAGVPVEIQSLCGLEELSAFQSFTELALLGRRRNVYVE